MALVWLIAALTCISLAESRLSPCTTPRGENGDCMRLASCPPLQAIISESWATRDQLTLLKQSTCGYPGEHKVCCPLQPTVEERSSCFTPEGHPGQCISVFHCSHVAERLQSPTVSQEDRAYVNSIRCSSPKGFSVCCGPPPNLIPDASPEPLLSDQCVLTAAPPDPQSQCCGSDGANPNKITDGNATGIDQYPWLALLEYKKGSLTLLMCGGSLISGRYVLTAGHCVAGTLITPTSVRLGEYDTSNPGRDCVAVEGGDEGDVDCTFEPVVIRVERIIPHPEYNPRSPLRRHDIAMLRLAELAPYTYFVRPICLPTTDVTLNFPTAAKLFVAGWGAISEKILSSNIKLHVDLPYKSIATCQAAYLTPNRRAKLWDRQICAGGEGGKDSCKGDSGGPLMYSTGTTYEVVGIVSFGPSPCGLDNVPGVYTKVFEYLAWIRSNIRR